MKTDSTISKNGRRTPRRQTEQAVEENNVGVATVTTRRRRSQVEPAGAPASELTAIPRLGPVRIDSLAAAGITRLSDLRSRSVEEIGSVKWVGLGNARRIKDWLARHDQTASGDGRLAAAPPFSTGPARSKNMAPKKKDTPALKLATRDDDAPPPGRATVIAPNTSSPGDSVEPGEEAQDGIEQIDSVISRIKETIPDKARRKKLVKQLEKVEMSVSEMPATLGKLRGREREQAAKALDQISKVLSGAVESGKLSDKKQTAIGADLKKARKRLEKALGT